MYIRDEIQTWHTASHNTFRKTLLGRIIKDKAIPTRATSIHFMTIA